MILQITLTELLRICARLRSNVIYVKPLKVKVIIILPLAPE